MTRAFLIVMDSFGIGASADASQYGDVGADTLRHIAEHCFFGQADKVGVRQGPLHLSYLESLGLYAAAELSGGKSMPGVRPPGTQGAYGYAVEKSLGKDTPSGHWEMMGVPVLSPWGYFSAMSSSFPETLLNDLMLRGKLTGVLGNCHASGTEIIAQYGEEHQKTGKPIIYTSADSVFQIAAHETSFGLERLYDLCEIARELVNSYHVGRVIARPFLGGVGSYYRTGNRRDLTMPPPSSTLLDKLVEENREVIGIGKISDIFAGRGITKKITAHGNAALFDAFLKEIQIAPNGSLVFLNLVDFDTLYGHRRDVVGYAKALEDFDARLPELFSLLQKGDLAIITADHGCDPTFPGSDHTREHLPVLAFGPSIQSASLGRRETLADIGQTIATHLGVATLSCGKSFV